MDDARRALREHFGFEGFRPGQEQAVAAALADRDVLVVMPTGAGKSLCYQLPALLRDDLTLVVSPLVSLMQDQVEALERVAPGRAALVNSQRDAAANRDAVERALRGEVRLLYVAPERFSSPAFLEQIRHARVGLFVVDEAHCVSQWGHDFRPDYFRLGDAARWLGAGSIVAATATATPQVAGDVVARLGLRDPERVTTGFDRPNLSFAVVRCRTGADERRRLTAALADPAARPAIVYAGTRALTEELRGRAARRRSASRSSPTTPASAARSARRRSGASWRARPRSSWPRTPSGWASTRPTCAPSPTPASPPRIEAYYQEAGRAGRDGRPARALLFAEGRDKGLHVQFIKRDEVGDADLERVAAGVIGRAVEGRYEVAAEALASGRDGADGVRAIVGHLARAGVLQPAPAPVDVLRGRVLAPFDGRARGACRASVRAAKDARWRQYHAVWAFVEGDDVPAGDDPAPLRRPGGACADRAVLRRLRPVARARPGRRGPRASPPPACRRGPTSTPRSSTWSRAPSRRSGARARWRSCAAAARRSS